MGTADLTTDAIKKALAEFDQLGREKFLAKYGFGKSRGYFVISNGRRYDSKAIAGVAHKFLGPASAPLRSAEFAGGEKSVAKLLRAFGFEVTSPEQIAKKGIPFEIGRTYNRKTDIHGVFGGQERGGISTPASVPFIFMFTGEAGGKYGYEDAWTDEGIFEYTGEGQHRDMEFIRGNRAIRDHSVNGRDLLLFQALSRKGQYRFLGSFICGGWDMRQGPDKEGMSRGRIVFHLVPVSEALEGIAGEYPPIPSLSLKELRQAAYEAAVASNVRRSESRRTVYERMRAVKDYVLARAKGVCESCGKPAPFSRKDGSPYLEPHHTRRVSDGGPDHPKWVGAICPNCHREIHHGRIGVELNRRLELYLREVER